MKKYVIGDIHGSYLELERLMTIINPDLHSEKIIFLGDYIDRGDDSYSVLQFLISLQKKYGNDHVVLLRGNHEQMAISNINKGYKGSFNGYDTTLRDFLKNNDEIENYLSFFNSLPLYDEDENFIYVHGGIKPGISMKNQSSEDLLWIRDEFIYSPSNFSKRVIFGHTPTRHINGKLQPYIKNDRIGIDTGCVFGGCLTALEIDSDGKIIDTHMASRNAA